MEELILMYTTKGYQLTFRPAPFESVMMELRYKEICRTTLLSIETLSHTVMMKAILADSEKEIILKAKQHTYGKTF